MLLGQLIVLVLSAVKRFDTVVLHARASVREFVGIGRSGGEVDLS